MAVNLNVPLVAQLNPSKSWYAAANMVNFYFRPGARFWAPDDERGGNSALNTLHFGLNPQLQMHFGLLSINANAPFEAKFLETLLQTRGPLLCIGNWAGALSTIVLTGVDRERVFYNDPVEPMAKSDKLSWFNTNITQRLPSPVLVKDPSSL